MTTATLRRTVTAVPDLAAIKQRQQATWAAGDYAVVGTTLQIVGERICEAVDLRAGERVLDVAAGNGNATLAAARRFAQVTSTDYVAALLDAGGSAPRRSAWPSHSGQADAEALPFDDGSFDVVLSTFGVMFTPDQDKAAARALRVVRPGGRIGLANWTPEGFIGQMFKTIGKHVPPPAGVQVARALGHGGAPGRAVPGDQSIAATRQIFNFRYRSPDHMLEIFRTYYGPMNRAFAALDAAGGRGAGEGCPRADRRARTAPARRR